MTHRLTRVDKATPRRAHCECGALATVSDWDDAVLWMRYHRRDPSLSPAYLATKHSLKG